MDTKIDAWAKKIYEENDFGRGVATSVSGVVGLGAYLLSNDWVIAAFSMIISFPIARISASSIQQEIKKRSEGRGDREALEQTFEKLSDEEKRIFRIFVDSGGCVMTWSSANAADVSTAGIESLTQRDLLWTTMTSDGMREAFAIRPELFDLAQQRLTDDA